MKAAYVTKTSSQERRHHPLRWRKVLVFLLVLLAFLLLSAPTG